MTDVLEYPDVVQENRGALNPGRLKLQRNSVIFKNVKTGKTDQFQSSDLDKIQWLKRARGHCLKFVLSTGGIHRYDGFKEAEFEKLSKFISGFYETELEKVDKSLKGWNWGNPEFIGNSLEFKVDNSLAFEIPLSNVTNATAAKNEVTIEFHQNDDASVSLMEVRFHIPPDPDPETDAVTVFHKNVMENADIIQISGESICTLSEIQCLTPRGRYDLKLFPSFLQLHGKTFDYKIPYQTILRLFLLPHKDGRQMFFVVSLSPPIKQGQTRYHFLILLFQKEDEMTLELNLTEEDIKTKYEDKLATEMTGLDFEVVSKVFKALTGRRITVPGSFIGHQGAQAVSCSYKAVTGLLYPLERGFIFVHKPPVHIRFDEVAGVNFARSAGSTRSFDFEVDTKTGQSYTFVGVLKEEYGKLYDFVKSKNLRVRNIGDKDGKSVSYNEMSDSDGDGGAHDAYMERMKAEGKDRDDDDTDDSSDESFNPGESGSEVAEEYDSNPPTTSGSDSDSDYSESGGENDTEEKKAAREVKRKAKEERRKEKEEKRAKEKQKKESKPKTERKKTPKEGGAKKRKKKGGDKDPNRPKRPQSGYFIWMNESRESIKKDYPGISITELTKKAGELWREMTDKTKWEELAAKAKVEYGKAMEEYNLNKPATESEDSGGEEKSKAKSKSKSKPKQKPSPKKKVESSGGGGGSGAAFKSKEYISSSGLSSEDDSDEPLQKKIKKKEEAKEEEASGEEQSEAAQSGNESEKEASAKGSESEKEASAKGSEPESGGEAKQEEGSDASSAPAQDSGSGSD